MSMHTHHALTRWLVAAALCLTATLSFSAQALAKDIIIPLQGLLTDDKGAPIDGPVELTFKLYPDASSAETVWSETRTVEIEGGLFSTYLGQTNPLGSELTLQHEGLYFSLTVSGDDETERVPLAHTLMAARAEHALDALTLQGKTLAELEGRPSSAQSTTYDSAQSGLNVNNAQAAIDALAARMATLEADNTALRNRVQTLEALDIAAKLQTLESTQQNHAGRLSSMEQTLMALQNQINTTSQTVSSFDGRIRATETTQTNHAGRLSTLESGATSLGSRLTSAESAINTLTTTTTQHNTRITTAQNLANSNKGRLDTVEPTVSAHTTSINGLSTRVQALEDKTQSLSTSVDGKQVYFSGVNLHVRSGTGSTTSSPNGTGNLIIGYDEARVTDSQKTGSHNLVLGRGNNYTSYGGLVGGSNNTISASYASILTGESGTASGSMSAIISGTGSSSENTTSVIVTGYQNKVTGYRSAVVSGWTNQASGSYAAVLGGESNIATGSQSTVGGGASIATTSYNKMSAQGTISP